MEWMIVLRLLIYLLIGFLIEWIVSKASGEEEIEHIIVLFWPLMLAGYLIAGMYVAFHEITYCIEKQIRKRDR